MCKYTCACTRNTILNARRHSKLGVLLHEIYQTMYAEAYEYCSSGVPGMVGGMLRHMRSLRSMKRDNGWIHTLLEEAENERMHLLTFLQLRQPGLLFRGAVLLAQVGAVSRGVPGYVAFGSGHDHY